MLLPRTTGFHANSTRLAGACHARLDPEGVSTGPEFQYLRAMSLSQFFMGPEGLKKKCKEIESKDDALGVAFELEKAIPIEPVVTERGCGIVFGRTSEMLDANDGPRELLAWNEVGANVHDEAMAGVGATRASERGQDERYRDEHGS